MITKYYGAKRINKRLYKTNLCSTMEAAIDAYNDLLKRIELGLYGKGGYIYLLKVFDRYYKIGMTKQTNPHKRIKSSLKGIPLNHIYCPHCNKKIRMEAESVCF